MGGRVMTTERERQTQPVISDDYSSDKAKLELWERMAKAVIRAYAKMPMASYNAKLNGELGELTEKIREIQPSLKSYYPLD
jgi:hypothetical protein